jgi:hypothetical protein
LRKATINLEDTPCATHDSKKELESFNWFSNLPRNKINIKSV